MIKFRDVTTTSFSSVSLNIERGKRYKIITDSDYERREFFDTLLALTLPLNGRVLLMGKDLSIASRKEVSCILQKIGVVWKYGGLISSLSILDSVLLPLKYHNENDKLENNDERSIDNMFKEFNSDTFSSPGYLRKMCGTLNIHDKRLIGITRAMICDPDLIIYESLFEGYGETIVNNLTNIVDKFHNKKKGRTSIFLSSKSEETSGKDTFVDFVIRQNRRKFSIEVQ